MIEPNKTEAFTKFEKIYKESMRLIEIISRRIDLQISKEKVKFMISDLQNQLTERLVSIHLLLQQMTETEKELANSQLKKLNEEALKFSNLKGE